MNLAYRNAERPDSGPGILADTFSLVRDDVLYRLQRRIGLIPAEGLGVARRALFYSMLAWLPLVVWAVAHGRVTGWDGESLFGHYAIHVRCLIGIPLLILAEAIAQGVIPLCLRQFARSGLVDEALAPRFREIVDGAARLRDRTYPWVIIGGLVLGWTIAVSVAPNRDEIGWGDLGGATGFATWWFLLVTVARASAVAGPRERSAAAHAGGARAEHGCAAAARSRAIAQRPQCCAALAADRVVRAAQAGYRPVRSAEASP
ncbi:hypothetical protein A2G96_22445 [Cupriavidus nantongensis]|uniref:Uncharacterized protein n=1 Tax=Cupriavidus nantongensis TaxID=1796606 RepID=A0A142JR93_9BURK|nr:hypothetical protein A2G96_22445 [Cupriavidus nantongensis]